MFTGVGLRACPVEGEATESLVVVPVGGDRENVCKQLAKLTTNATGPLGQLAAYE